MSSDIAKQVRTTLKARGLGPRSVSVVSDSYSMGSTVRVTIKAWRIPLGEVEALVRPFERVARDEGTGEILSGGNTHISVSYDRSALEEPAQTVARLLAREETQVIGDVTLMPTSMDRRASELSVYDLGGTWLAYVTRETGAVQLARLLATRGSLAAVVDGYPHTVTPPQTPEPQPVPAEAVPELAMPRRPRMLKAPAWRTSTERQATKTDLVDIARALDCDVSDETPVPAIRALIQQRLSAR